MGACGSQASELEVMTDKRERLERIIQEFEHGIA